MKHIYSIFFLLFVLAFSQSFAGDTLKVTTFTFGSPQNATFWFPPDTFRVEKILMNYKLKCNPAQTPACGEWDYLTYTYLYENTGLMDSITYQAPSFIAGGASPDSFQYNTSQSYSYSTDFQYFQVIDATTSFDSCAIPLSPVGVGSSFPFKTENPQSRTQYLWTAAELLAGGLSAGNITGFRLKVESVGSNLNNLRIRLRHSSLTNFTTSIPYDTAALTTVYFQNTSLAGGWNTFQFTSPFNWNGTSALLVDISYENQNAGTSTLITNDVAPGMGSSSSGNDRSSYFFGNDYVSVPFENFSTLDSNITVSFWQYGNPAFQPQNQMTFEGSDSLNRRVINAHLPWSNSRVYWDAGNSGTGSYDRIDQAATSSQYAGKWNHWAFTKNVQSGRMTAFLNGSQFHGGSGMTRTMNGIKNFKIGAAASGGNFYDGNIDEFQVFDTDLDSATINQWMYKDLDPTHPAYANLKSYFRFNNTNVPVAISEAPGSMDGTYFGTPEIPYIKGSQLFRNFNLIDERPSIIFEQGVYTSHLDSTLVIDSIANPSTIVILFGDVSNPTTATDTIQVWQPYYTYVYNSSGVITDSTLVGPDNTLYLTNTPYYGVPFEVVNRYEIGRFITPYGNGLDLGSGFTWVYDVTDYEPLLHDSVHLSSGNWQELMEVTFDFVKGTPARDVIKVENVWSGNYGLNNFNTSVANKTVTLGAGASQFRVKTRTTGHGFDNPSNCAEFCQKNHYLRVDGTLRYTWLLWDECSLNPVYPQGGTWVYDRAGWCPGKDVLTYDWELTPFVSPGTTADLEYNIDSDPDGNYVLESNMISYGASNFVLDAGVEHVKSPSKTDQFKRMNPICSNPIITIKNNGTTPLTSLKINYGMQGAALAEFNWTGSLGFLETEDVTLGSFWWTDSSNVFEVNVSEPNGGVDEYADNNKKLSEFSIPPSYPSSIVFEFTTGNSLQNSYTITDENGIIIHSRNGSSVNTTYKDTITFDPGCYHFLLTDAGDDGLSWWANTGQGNGIMRLRKANASGVLKNFGSDFGREISHQFSINYFLNMPEYKPSTQLQVFPNPTTSNLNVELGLSKTQDMLIELYSITGVRVFAKNLQHIDAIDEEIDMKHLDAGIYFLKITSAETTISRKVVKMK